MVISGAIEALIFVAVTAQHDADEHLHLDSVDQLAQRHRSPTRSRVLVAKAPSHTHATCLLPERPPCQTAARLTPPAAACPLLAGCSGAACSLAAPAGSHTSTTCPMAPRLPLPVRPALRFLVTGSPPPVHCTPCRRPLRHATTTFPITQPAGLPPALSHSCPCPPRSPEPRLPARSSSTAPARDHPHNFSPGVSHCLRCESAHLMHSSPPAAQQCWLLAVHRAAPAAV
ncbi:hypothetical protein B0H14DRAFT_3448961 [Mycena olivaceomarginata]|nr:hypothetical protein B0H14DRAFT_3448961 [Mycena olivaceomarginata]